MDEKRDKNISASEEASSPYRDALYSRASEEGNAGYGYNLAQCYARASSGETTSPPKKKNHSGLGVLTVSACLIIGILLVGLFGSGSMFMTSRASAAEATPSRELYDDFTISLVSTDDGSEDLALTIAGEAEADPSAELTAEEIYSIACGCTVGVTVPGYSYNIFGHVSAKTVNGTGIVLSEDGYILTNYHIIEAAYSKGASIIVYTYDGAEHEAEVIGVETDSDLAVLKIQAEGLVPAQMANSEEIHVGQTIYAVGNPLGELTYTMTSGIVSALDRRITTDEHVTVNMFQIDAAINSGNSGGPVFNVYGQVIGVVTAKYSLYGMEGLGFAIPISDACDIASDLVEKGYVSGKAYLGLTMASVSPSVARYYDMVEGVYVYEVEPGSCSEEAGIVEGDIITAIDGKDVLTSSALALTVKEYRAGDSAELTVYRDQEYITVTVIFDEELPAGLDTADAQQGGASAEIDISEG